MTHSIPIIRAAAIAPIRRWLSESGRNPDALLARADLAWVPEHDLLLPIPLRNAIRLLVEVAHAEGPDAPHRIVRAFHPSELGLIGAEAVDAPTVREGLNRIARAMPFHSTHEVFTVNNDCGAVRIKDGWTFGLRDDETLHLVQQYVTALADGICRAASGPPPCLAGVAMFPHPEAGLSHLRSWLGDRVWASDHRMLQITVAEDVADRPFPERTWKMPVTGPEGELTRLRQAESLSDDVITLMMSELPRRTPSVDGIAAAAGISGRTLKRRLRGEGQSFSGLLAATRARLFRSRVGAPDVPALKELSRELGYSDQATLSRAVRRWTGRAPSDFRDSGQG